MEILANQKDTITETGAGSVIEKDQIVKGRFLNLFNLKYQAQNQEIKEKLHF